MNVRYPLSDSSLSSHTRGTSQSESSSTKQLREDEAVAIVERREAERREALSKFEYFHPQNRNRGADLNLLSKVTIPFY